MGTIRCLSRFDARPAPGVYTRAMAQAPTIDNASRVELLAALRQRDKKVVQLIRYRLYLLDKLDKTEEALADAGVHRRDWDGLPEAGRRGGRPASVGGKASQAARDFISQPGRPYPLDEIMAHLRTGGWDDGRNDAELRGLVGTALRNDPGVVRLSRGVYTRKGKAKAK